MELWALTLITHTTAQCNLTTVGFPVLKRTYPFESTLNNSLLKPYLSSEILETFLREGVRWLKSVKPAQMVLFLSRYISNYEADTWKYIPLSPEVHQREKIVNKWVLEMMMVLGFFFALGSMITYKANLSSLSSPSGCPATPKPRNGPGK